jgi:hypothetical protein
MRIPPQVTDRVKEAPAQALRAVFSGIGQVLLVADRIKSRATVPERPRPAAASPAAADPQAQSRPAAATVVRDETRWRSLDETGNVRVLSEEEPAADTSAEPAPAAAEPAPAAAEPAPAAAEPAADTSAEPSAPRPASLPVPNYDSLTLASLRARLRNLDVSQVRVLFDYEKSNASRADVLTMFERRIAKLDSGEA